MLCARRCSYLPRLTYTAPARDHARSESVSDRWPLIELEMNRRIGRSRTRIHSLSSSCSISRSGTEHGRQRPDKPSLSRAANPNRGRGRPISIVPRCAKTMLMLSMQCLCVRACMQYSYTVTVLLQCKLAMPGEKEKQVAAKLAFSPRWSCRLSPRAASALCALQRRLPSGSGHPSDRTSTSFRLWISNHAVAAHPHTHTPPVA